MFDLGSIIVGAAALLLIEAFILIAAVIWERTK